MNFYFPDGNGGKQLLETGNSETYSLPTASAEVKGGVKIGNGLSVNGEVLSATGLQNPVEGTLSIISATDSLEGGTVDLSGDKKGGVINLAGKFADTASGGSIQGHVHFTDKVIFDNGAKGLLTELPTASESVLGGIKLGDEFRINEGGEKLRLSGKVNSYLDLGNCGFSVGSGGSVTLDNANIKLDGSTLKTSAGTKANINLPNVDITLGSVAHPLTLDLESASLRVDSTNFISKRSGDSINFNTYVAFRHNVSVTGPTLFENTVSCADSLKVSFGEASSLTAEKDYIDISRSTVIGNAASVSGNIHFTGTPVFDNGVSGIDSAYILPTASATQKGGIKIGTGLSMDGETLNCTVTGGLTNPIDGTLSIRGSVGQGGTLDLHGINAKGGTLDLSGHNGSGGTILLTGSTSTYKAGTIDFSPNGGLYGEILGAPKFTDGFRLGSNIITQMKIENGSLVITVDGTTLTLGGGITLGTVASTAQGSVWLGTAY